MTRGRAVGGTPAEESALCVDRELERRGWFHSLRLREAPSGHSSSPLPGPQLACLREGVETQLCRCFLYCIQALCPATHCPQYNP